MADNATYNQLIAQGLTPEAAQGTLATMARKGITSLNLPSTIAGQTTYGDTVPQTAKSGDIIAYGDKLNSSSPSVQNLLNTGAASQYGNTGVMFNKDYTAQSNQPYRAPQFNLTSPYPTGGTGAQLASQYGNQALPTSGPQAQPNVPYYYEAQSLPQERLASEDYKLRHELNLLLGSKNVPKDLTSFINAKVFGGYTSQDVANHIYESMQKGTSNIVSPNISRWHNIVGANYGTGGQGAGGAGQTGVPTGLGAGMDSLSQMALGMNITPPQGEEITPPGLPDYSDLIAQQNALYQQEAAYRKSENERALQAINEQFGYLIGETKLKGDQNAAQNYAYLSRLGAMGNTTAAMGFMNGIQAENTGALLKVEKARQAAVAAQQALAMGGSLQAYRERVKEMKDLAFKTTEDMNNQWNQLVDAKKFKLSDFQAKSNFLLGAYGIALDAAKLQQASSQFAQTLKLDQDKFDEIKRQNGVEEAMKWAKLNGYGKGMIPTADKVNEILGETKENYSPIQIGGQTYYQKAGEKNYISEDKYNALPSRAQVLAETTPYKDMKNLSAADYLNIKKAYGDSTTDETFTEADLSTLTNLLGDEALAQSIIELGLSKEDLF